MLALIAVNRRTRLLWNPRAAAERRASGVLDEGDLHTYRTLLAQSEDLNESGPGIMQLAQTE
jgi:hypothetical protein